MENFWVSTLPSNYYDSLLKDGFNKNKGVQANWHNLTFIKVYSTIKDSNKHLDFACGSGSFIGNYLTQEATGVDISLNQINYAKKTYGHLSDFYTLDEFDLKKYNQYFDSISVIGLLEYLDEKDTLDLLENLYSILKDGGKLILTTPNYSLPMLLLEKISHLLGPINYSSEHKSKYKYKKLKETLTKTKFSGIKIEKFINLAILFSIFNLKLGVSTVNKFDSILKNKFGFLFFIELKK